jgi:hypothetical protein
VFSPIEAEADPVGFTYLVMPVQIRA